MKYGQLQIKLNEVEVAGRFDPKARGGGEAPTEARQHSKSKMTEGMKTVGLYFGWGRPCAGTQENKDAHEFAYTCVNWYCLKKIRKGSFSKRLVGCLVIRRHELLSVNALGN